MFDFGEIWAFPTDTSFGFGVRADDAEGLEGLMKLKGDRSAKYFSLMCANEEMLRDFAEVPSNFNSYDFFFKNPRTAIFRPSEKLPKSNHWPRDKVAFRVSTIPDIAANIRFPITATSANLTGQNPIFEVKELQKTFGDKIRIYEKTTKLPKKNSSEIWDFVEYPPKQIR